jgi:hypothetical protein
MQFQRWQDSKSIDFNGWWQIEVSDDSSCCKLRNFNSGKYLSLSKDENDSKWSLNLTDDADQAVELNFIAVNSDKVDINTFNEAEIFKIKIANDLDDKFLVIESNEDQDAFFKEEGFYNKKVTIGQQTLVNKYDTFKVIIPKEDEYNELSFCIDTREYIHSFASKLYKSKDVLTKVSHFKEGMAKIFIKLLEFMQNRHKGKTRIEYSVGKIVPHRQEMVSKVGIIDIMFTLLEFVKDKDNDEIKDEILSQLYLSADDFAGFDNLLEVIIKTIHITAKDNQNNTMQCIHNMHIIEHFVYVDGCTAFLIDIFKDKSFELSKKEIHTELLYRRIFEINRFERIVMHFTEKLSQEREPKYLLILRKM